MANVTLSGRVKKVFDTKVTTGANGKEYKNREFWLEEIKDKYASTWKLELQGDKCDLVEDKEGGEADVLVEITGRYYAKDGKENVYNTLKAYGVTIFITKEPLYLSELGASGDLPF